MAAPSAALSCPATLALALLLAISATVDAQGPFLWTTDYPGSPEMPVVGGKSAWTFYVVNAQDKVIPKGTLVSLWSNKTEYVKCGETADADVEYRLPELLPYQTHSFTVKLPYTSAAITPNATAYPRIFIDSTCTVYDESADAYQQDLDVEVFPKGTKYVLLKSPAILPDSLPSTFYGEPEVTELDPPVPKAGETFTAYFKIQNKGTVSSPKGVVLQIWANFPFDGSADPDCNNTGGVLVEMPTIPPGKTKTVKVEGLVAPAVSNRGSATLRGYVDATCVLGPQYAARVNQDYLVLPSPSAFFGGVRNKGQLTYNIKTTPKAPKANGTMTVTLKFQNKASTEGAIGVVGVWLTPFAESYALSDGGTWQGGTCAYEGFVTSADFSSVVVKPGKSKTVKITDVPVPAMAGWWELSAVPDINCTLPGSEIYDRNPIIRTPYAAFEVVA